jgi:two-component system C4-dicarboxylate transport response regulator DctD
MLFMPNQSITRVLVVDDDASVREAVGQTIELAGLTPTLAGTYIEAKDHISTEFAGVVVSDIRMPGKDGFELLALAQTVDPDLPVILLTGEGDIPMAVKSMGAGAFDFLEKPCDPKELIAVVEKALRQRLMVLENRRLKLEQAKGDVAARLLRGTSQSAQMVREKVRTFARSAADILITGEPGVGTAKTAEVIHLLSAGAQAPFLKFSAASQTPESLATAFEHAQHGTVFLDEVAALPAAAQFALLDLLEQRDRARLVVGTYADLSQKVAAEVFSPDLFYRLEAAVIHILPLRERRDDIAVLFRHYVDIACEQSGLAMPSLAPEMIADLVAQDWPGNSRSLMNAAMRFAMSGRPEGVFGEAQGSGSAGTQGLSEKMAQVERSLLIAALQRHNGNATAAAKDLKVPRKTFYDKLTRHNILAEAYRGL